jgi:hypothetical protein
MAQFTVINIGEAPPPYCPVYPPGDRTGCCRFQQLVEFSFIVEEACPGMPLQLLFLSGEKRGIDKGN